MVIPVWRWRRTAAMTWIKQLPDLTWIIQMPAPPSYHGAMPASIRFELIPKENTMRQFLPILFAAIVLGPAARADEQHHRPEPARPAAKVSANDAHLAEAHAQMKKMMAQMGRIKATQDPEERARLMREHMDSMHQAMQAMRAGGSGMMHMKECPMKRASGGRAADRMDMMEKRMDMMQMMMEQMVEREGMNLRPKQE